MPYYNRQLSEVIKIKKLRIITSFVNPEGPKTRTNKTGINLLIFIHSTRPKYKKNGYLCHRIVDSFPRLLK